MNVDPMSPADHYRAAEQILGGLEERTFRFGLPKPMDAVAVALAQVHATLAAVPWATFEHAQEDVLAAKAKAGWK